LRTSERVWHQLKTDLKRVKNGICTMVSIYCMDAFQLLVWHLENLYLNLQFETLHTLLPPPHGRENIYCLGIVHISGYQSICIHVKTLAFHQISRAREQISRILKESALFINNLYVTSILYKRFVFSDNKMWYSVMKSILLP